MKSRDRPLLFFTHVQKAGGTTVEAVMRRNFGMKHLVVHPRNGWVYDRRDLEADVRLNPLVRSIAGHWLRPFIDFGPLNDRIVWYTILRDPLKRYVSHYQHHVEHFGSKAPFERWMRKRVQWNWQTRLLAGEPDLEAAKQLLETRYRSVALLERFEESLVLMRERLGLDGFRLSFGRPRNAASQRSASHRLRDELAGYEEQIAERNQLDLELYRFAAEELFPRQIDEYGSERLARDVQSEFATYSRTVGDLWREGSNAFFRRAVYLPTFSIRSAIARSRGETETRA